MSTLTINEIAGMARHGSENVQICALLGRQMTEEELNAVHAARGARRLKQAAHRIELDKRKADKAAQPEDDKALKTDRIKAQVLLLRAKIAQIEKTSVPLSEVREFWLRAGALVRGAFDNWCDRIAARGDAKDAKAARAAADRCLTRLADALEQLDDERVATLDGEYELDK